MTPQSVVLRAAARRDVDEATAHYLDEAGPQVAVDFIDALQDALRHISDNPQSGSPRYGHEVNLPGLRSWPLKNFPQPVFYMTGHGPIDVWRVLHSRRHIPDWLRES